MSQAFSIRAASIVGACLLAAAPTASAAVPSPLASGLFGFPGITRQPASATSAGLALADRWLGDEPFDNPAAASSLGVAVSGALLHVSRQDLRAANRNFDETPAFFDGAGLSVGLPNVGRFGFSLYGYQPVLRQEQNAFSRGTGTPDPANPPGTIETQSSARELRAGLGLTVVFGDPDGTAGPGVTIVRVGGAVEYTRREDSYKTLEISGDPAAGTRRLDLSGDAIGVQAGARIDRGDPSDGGLSIGVAARHVPALPVDASLLEDLTAEFNQAALTAVREEGWEFGTSARYAVSPSFRALAALGGSTAQTWEGFDLTAGSTWEWKLAGELHDARDPWTLRFGLGQERQSGDTDTRANVIGLGLGWRFTRAALDLGLAHRTLSRPASPNSFEDRIVLTLRTP